MRYSHFMYNTYPIPTAASPTAPWLRDHLITVIKIKLTNQKAQISPKRDFFGWFPLSQNFREFRAEVKWKGPFRFGPTGIFGTTSGGGPLWPVVRHNGKHPKLLISAFWLVNEIWSNSMVHNFCSHHLAITKTWAKLENRAGFWGWRAV